jgi:hypothetical protein
LIYKFCDKDTGINRKAWQIIVIPVKFFAFILKYCAALIYFPQNKSPAGKWQGLIIHENKS